MANVQTLGTKHSSKLVQNKFRQDLEIFNRLAVLERYGEDGLPIFYNQDDEENKNIGEEASDQEVYVFKTLLISIIEKELNLPYDEKIDIHIAKGKWFSLSLAQTTIYNEDEKANIYYMFYGMNVFIPYATFPNANDQVLRVATGLLFNGIRKYWQGTPGSFFGEYLDAAEIEESKPFAESFHLLAMYYLALNGYYDYQEAKDNDFNIINGG